MAKLHIILPHQTEAFYAALGRLTSAFAELERISKSFLASLISRSDSREDTFPAEMVIADFQLELVVKKIRLLAEELEPEPWKEHLSHAMNCVDRLRGYRNYYVHGVMGVTEQDQKLGGRIVTSDTRKGRYREAIDFVSIEALDDISSKVFELIHYIMTIKVLRAYGEEKVTDARKRLNAAKLEMPAEVQKPHRMVIPAYHEIKGEQQKLAKELGIETERADESNPPTRPERGKSK